MRKPIAFVFAVSLILVAVLLPTGSSQATVSVPTQLMGVYFNGPDVGGDDDDHYDPVTTTAPGPKAKTDKNATLCQSNVCSPATSGFVVFDGMADNGIGGVGYTINSDLLLTVWLSTDRADPNVPVIVRGLGVKLADEGPGTYDTLTQEIIARNNSEELLTLSEKPRPFSVAFKNPNGILIPKDARLALHLMVMVAGRRDNVNTAAGPVAVDSPVDVRLHYGSVMHPSGLFFTVNVPLPPGKALGSAFRLSLTETGFKPGIPTGATSRARDLPGDFPEAATTTWATSPWKADRAYTFLSDMMFNASFAFPGEAPDASAFIDLKVSLIVKGTPYNGTLQYRMSQLTQAQVDRPDNSPHADVCAPETCTDVWQPVIALPTRGLKVPAGAPVQLELLVTSKSASEAPFQILFDSKANPSGFLAAVTETAGGAASSTTATSSSASPSTTPTTTPVTSSSSAGTTAVTSSSAAPEGGDGVGGKKDIGNPAQVVPNLTFLWIVAGAALALMIASRRR